MVCLVPPHFYVPASSFLHKSPRTFLPTALRKENSRTLRKESILGHSIKSAVLEGTAPGAMRDGTAVPEDQGQPGQQSSWGCLPGWGSVQALDESQTPPCPRLNDGAGKGNWN